MLDECYYNMGDYYYDINKYLVVNLGYTSNREQPLYKGQMRGVPTCRLFKGSTVHFLVVIQ